MSGQSPVPSALALQGSSGLRQGSPEASQGSPEAWQESTLALTSHELPCITVPCALADIGRTVHALQALPVLGISARANERFRCVLPGHSDAEPSAVVRWDSR